MVTFPKASGFTLIELSIVLVIIGLISAGILLGKDMIHAASIRATIGQIEKYDTAVNTFQSKYSALPGDMIPGKAAQFGFVTRTGAEGNGDGNGLVYALGVSGVPGNGWYALGGENVLFWTDISASHLIDGNFTDSTDALINADTEDEFAALLPRTKLGGGTYFYVNGNYWDFTNNRNSGNGYQIINLIIVGNGMVPMGQTHTEAALTPLDTFNIDSKVDDGIPLSGKAQAMFPDRTMQTGAGRGVLDSSPTLCATGVAPYTYNTGGTEAKLANCSLRIRASW